MGVTLNYHQRHREWQRRFLRRLLKVSGYSATRAAAKAGLNRTHFYKMCKKLGINDVLVRDYRRKAEAREGNSAWAELGQGEHA